MSVLDLSYSDLRVSVTEAEREALRAARHRKGIRIKVIARQLGVAPKTLLHWQMGIRRPTSYQLTAWWKAVGP